ncbi:MAG TPA: hypothetical protein VFB15_07790 [Candidatus Binataceae bacterium]|nr:hypothetical protein [Candidatus Binataceae bacterium]
MKDVSSAHGRNAIAVICLIGASALALLLVAAPASAKSYCITGWPNPAWDDIGVGFTVPAKGKCKSFTGFNPANAINMPLSGVGCTSSDGTNLSLTLTVSAPGSFVEIDDVSLSLPSGTGSGGCEILESSSETSCTPLTTLVGAKCKPPTISAVGIGPVPTIMDGDGQTVR